ncbi:hypothetical protein [Nostoc sp. MG11]|uniref:hypothetical protein n=1 Tax=Nostoc sp. MG11 TaxID=2721166 RepID=UPI001D025438|nr:hypothetical protein [Nostoc sp. MG11]
MNEQRLQVYCQLIKSLLDCPNGQEPEILAANTELLDAGFLQVLAVVAEHFAEQGEENIANWLRNLATQLTPKTTPITPQDIEAYKATEYIERSKNRNLVELILNRDSRTIFPPEVVTQLEQLENEIASSQYQPQNGKAENPTDLAQHLQQLRQHRQ